MCLRRFNDVSNLNAHMKKQHSNEKFKRKVCSEIESNINSGFKKQDVMPDKTNASRKIKDFEKDTENINIVKGIMQEHEQSISDQTILKCNICAKVSICFVYFLYSCIELLIISIINL